MPASQTIQTLLLRARLQLEEEMTEEAFNLLRTLTTDDEQQQKELRYLTGWAYIQRQEWEQAITTLAPLLSEAEGNLQEEILRNEHAQLSDRERLVHYLLQLGIAAINLEQYHDASLHLTHCLKVLHDRRVHVPKVRIQARYSLATAYLMRGLLHLALQHYQDALRLCDFYERDDERGNIYYGLAYTYRDLSDLLTAASYAQKALTFYQERDQGLMECRMQNLMGRIIFLLGDYQAAIHYFTLSLAQAHLYGSSLMATLNCAALADVRMIEGNLEEARQYSEIALKTAKQLKGRRAHIPYQLAGKVAHKAAQAAEGQQRDKLLREAASWYQQATDKVATTQARTEIAEIYGEYALVLEDLQQPREALHYWRASYRVLERGQE